MLNTFHKMSIDALQGEKKIHFLYIHVHTIVHIKKMYFFIGNRKFIVANKYNILKKSEPHFLSD